MNVLNNMGLAVDPHKWANDLMKILSATSHLDKIFTVIAGVVLSFCLVVGVLSFISGAIDFKQFIVTVMVTLVLIGGSGAIRIATKDVYIKSIESGRTQMVQPAEKAIEEIKKLTDLLPSITMIEAGAMVSPSLFVTSVSEIASWIGGIVTKFFASRAIKIIASMTMPLISLYWVTIAVSSLTMYLSGMALPILIAGCASGLVGFNRLQLWLAVQATCIALVFLTPTLIGAAFSLAFIEPVKNVVTSINHAVNQAQVAMARTRAIAQANASAPPVFNSAPGAYDASRLHQMQTNMDQASAQTGSTINEILASIVDLPFAILLGVVCGFAVASSAAAIVSNFLAGMFVGGVRSGMAGMGGGGLGFVGEAIGAMSGAVQNRIQSGQAKTEQTASANAASARETKAEEMRNRPSRTFETSINDKGETSQRIVERRPMPFEG